MMRTLLLVAGLSLASGISTVENGGACTSWGDCKNDCCSDGVGQNCVSSSGTCCGHDGVGKATSCGAKVAGPSPASGINTATCALNGAEAVDEMLDSAVYIMASIARCDNSKDNKEFSTVACALDVSSAIEAVNGMINVIMKAVGKCGALKDDHYKCGLAVGVLTRSFAGLASASSGIVAKCPNKLNGMKAMDSLAVDKTENAQRYGGDRAFKEASLPDNLGQCVINVKDTMKALFKAIKRIMTVKDSCAGGANSYDCQHNSVKIVSAFTALGEYLSGAIGKCDAKTHSTALCVQMSFRLIRALENTDKASVAMKNDCDIGAAERLYLEDAEKKEHGEGDDNKVSMALSALLPLTAVVAFVGGSRFAKSRAVVSTSDSDLSETDPLGLE